jgi:DNA (cytosine-5)-methyltransferase 1
MRYGSVCSGIEAASVAWHPLGWKPQWFSEIEHFPSAVLKHRFPDVPNLGDMTQLNQNPVFNEQPIDLLVGGTPCQSFSVAGLRKGLADPRGNLMLTFLSIADKRRPKWIVWENVPGVLSSNGGRDFGTFLGALGELGYGFAYRVLDAQFFGVAQRRRRVFVVGYLGDWRPAAAVLFESESLQRNPKPSRAKRQETSTDAEGSVRATGFAGNVESQVAACLQTTCDDYSRADGFNTVIEQVAQPIPINTMTVMGRPSDDLNPRMGIGIGNPNDPCPTLTKAHHHAVAQPIAVDTYNYTTNEHTTQTIRSQSDTEHIGAVLQTMAIRRLTPKECERLQGFPDDWTKIPYRNKPAEQCPDGPRYKACGNSMAVPVMRWIGTRIQMIENYLNP